jgi:hypothetical protein
MHLVKSTEIVRQDVMFVQLIILGRIDLVIIIYGLIYIILYLLFIYERLKTKT